MGTVTYYFALSPLAFARPDGIVRRMPRVARIVIPGRPHHVTQRGNNRQDVFFVDDNREAYLAILGRQAARYGLQVLGYCLMTDHVHLVAGK